MLLAEDFAEGTLHRLVLFHAVAGHAGTGEGPSLGRPALPGTKPRTVSPGHSTSPCPLQSSAPARRATGGTGVAARLEMRATWTGKRLRLSAAPPRGRPTPPAAFLPASFYNRPLLARPSGLGTLPGPRPEEEPFPSPRLLLALLLHPPSPRGGEEAGKSLTSKEGHDLVNRGTSERTAQQWGDHWLKQARWSSMDTTKCP